MSKGELQELGQRMGWNPNREISMSEIRSMGSTEFRFHELLNPNFATVFERAANIEHSKRAMEQWTVKRMFDDEASPEELDAAVKEAQRFSASHPQFLGPTKPTNRTKLFQWLRERNLAITYENFCSGFAELAMAGELIVSAACIGDDTELTGQALRNYPRLPELLQPHRIPTAEESMSADEWKSCHPELVDRRRPPLIAARL